MATIHDAADKSNGNTPLIPANVAGGERRPVGPDALPPLQQTTHPPSPQPYGLVPCAIKVRDQGIAWSEG